MHRPLNSKRLLLLRNPAVLLQQRLLRVAGCSLILLFLFRAKGPSRSTTQPFTDVDSQTNAAIITERRNRLRSECDPEMAETFFQPPDRKSTQNSKTNNNKNNLPPLCDYTFLDLGANVGDSLGKFIDVGLVDSSTSCSTRTTNTADFSAHYNVTEARVAVVPHHNINRLTRWARDMLRQA